MARTYRATEIFVVDTDPGINWVGVEYGPKGERNARSDEARLRRYVEDEVTRECLAAHIPFLDGSEFVSIPHQSVDGEIISDEAYTSLLYDGQGNGVLVATGSGEKGGNYIRITKDAFAALAKPWRGKPEAPKFAQAVGLLWSSMTDGLTREVWVNVITPGHEYDRGQDGNGMAPKGEIPCSIQIRGMEHDDPTKVVKGIVSPTSPDGEWWIHHSQLKGTWSGQEQRVKLLLAFNHGVASESIPKRMLNAWREGRPWKKGDLRQRRSWMSSEVTALIRNTKENRREASLRVRDEVHKLVSIFGDRVRLLDRWGGLNVNGDGVLDEPWNAAIDALRTPLPMCAELAELLGRFAVPEVVQIAHGAGVRVAVSLIVQDDKYGVPPISVEKARGLKARGLPVWALYRVPTTGAQAVVYFDQCPYKKGIGFVVHSAAAHLMDGDSDGDLAFMILDHKRNEDERQRFSETYWLLGALDYRVSGTTKPPKEPKAPRDITEQDMLDYWVDQLAIYPLVGQATMLGWRALRDGRIEDAIDALAAANAAPMLNKHDVSIGGKPLADVIAELREIEPKPVEVVMPDGKIAHLSRPLKWREFMAFSRTVSIPHQLRGWRVEAETVLDSCGNAAAFIIGKWNEKNPLEKLTMARTARLVFHRHGAVLPGWAVRGAAKIRQEWRNYWVSHMRELPDGSVEFFGGPHNGIFDKIREMGADAEAEVLAALLGHNRKQGENMTLKWTAIFDTHRGVEVLGLHDEVIEALRARKALKEARKRAYVEVSLDNNEA